MKTLELVRTGNKLSKLSDDRQAGRWLQYQSERFPIVQYAPLVLAFAGSGLALSYLTLESAQFPTLHMFITAFSVAFLTFVQLRVSDEFKDREFDLKHHPERPVPRGLVELKELKNIAIGAGVVQVVLSLALSPLLLVPLFAMWAYLFLMHNEFFIGKWLNEHQVPYMLLHMGILFFTDLFITACHWLVVTSEPASALLFFFGTSFKLGMVIEIGRKIKAPCDEVAGANTYSRTWGADRATLVWLATVFASGVFALITAAQVGFALEASVMVSTMFVLCTISAIKFLKSKTSKSAKRIETLSGLWTLATYITVGVAPLVFKVIAL